MDAVPRAPVAHFETPENVRVRYPLAGPGTRFLAWLIDQVLVVVLCTVLCVALLAAGIASGTLAAYFDRLQAADLQQRAPQVTMYFVGAMLLVVGFGSFAYYFTSELLGHGRTVGKRLFGLRVVKADGFSLDPLSLFIRNALRTIDHFAIVWPIPLLSARTQRPGDMAAGTLVVLERPIRLSPLRSELAGRTPLESRFRFDSRQLSRLRAVDVAFIEQFLERWAELPRRQWTRLAGQTLPPLSRRLRVTPPATNEARVFFEDLLAAEYARRRRSVA
jgi:uncharacterized RDD family membrane protein YckC